MKKILYSILIIALIGAILLFPAINRNKVSYYNKFALNNDRTVILKSSQLVQTNEDNFLDVFKNMDNIRKIECNGFFAVITNDGKVKTNSIYNEEVEKWTNITDVAIGYDFIVGLKSDKTLLAAGENNLGQCEVWKFKDIKEVKAGAYHTVMLSKDGKLYSVGEFEQNQREIYDWSDIKSIECGPLSTFGIKNDGSIVTTETGENYDFSKFTDINKLAISRNHVVGLRNDGSVVATGSNLYGQCNVLEFRDIVAVKVSNRHTVLIKSDGSMIAVGDNSKGQLNIEGAEWNIKI